MVQRLRLLLLFQGKSLDCQHLHCGSQLSVSPIPVDHMPSFDLHSHFMQIVGRHIRRENIHIHEIKIKI